MTNGDRKIDPETLSHRRDKGVHVVEEVMSVLLVAARMFELKQPDESSTRNVEHQAGA
jgi:hypothetical protein